jgi:hypothetical protein
VTLKTITHPIELCSSQELKIKNVFLVLQIDCRELRQSSPLSQVIPPMSKAHLPIIFESNNKGKFQR